MDNIVLFRLCYLCKYDYQIASISSIMFNRAYYQITKQISSKPGNEPIKKNGIIDPRLLILLSIVAATKCENYRIKILNLLNNAQMLDMKYKYTVNDIISNELEFIKLLRFDFNITLPFNILFDLLCECNLLNILSKTWKLILMTFRSNIYLIYPPYLIVFGCIYIICSNEKIKYDIFLLKYKIPIQNILNVSSYIIKNYDHIFVQIKSKQIYPVLKKLSICYP